MLDGSERTTCGFTLIELVLVLVIVSLTIAVVMPRVGAGWRRMEDREFLQELIDTLRRARLYAMHSGEVVTFRIRSAERLYDLQVPPRKSIPSNVDLYADHLEQDPETRDYLILFYPDGSIVGSRLEVVFDHSRSFRIYMHPIFGTVQWSKVESR